MGQEIAGSIFTDEDFAGFHRNLAIETEQLQHMLQQGQLKADGFHVGLELEAWLIDKTMRPAAVNDTFLKELNDPLASAELAKFNIEFNTDPVPLSGPALSQIQQQLQNTWSRAAQQAQKLGCELLMTGILPTLEQDDLTILNMSDLHRYRALNEQVLKARGGPVNLDISGIEHLKLTHNDVMLESTATSLQLHTQVPADIAHHFYNASIIASAAMVAVCANSPFLFGKELWQETRIPVFEQAVECGGYQGAAHGPLKRVGFGSDFARHSIFECFQENLEHFPVLLPVRLNEDSALLPHLRLHNGTIWRWNRPLIGFENGQAHVRIEHRTPAAGPTVNDILANAAFYFGLSYALCHQLIEDGLPMTFSDARDNFYKAARFGLNAHVIDLSGQHQRLQQLVLDKLLPLAHQGLNSLGLDSKDIDHHLTVIEQRVSKQTGSDWQTAFVAKHGRDFQKLTRQYLYYQQQNKVVSEWPI